MIDKLFPVNRFPSWLPWFFLAAIAIYLVKTQVQVRTVFYPDTITSSNQLDAYLSTASKQYPYSYPGTNTIPNGNAWI